MTLKWGEEKIKGLSDPIKKAEEVNEWGWWGLFLVVIVMAIAFILEVTK